MRLQLLFLMIIDSVILQEATRAFQSLNPVERGVLVLTRSILGRMLEFIWKSTPEATECIRFIIYNTLRVIIIIP